MKTTLFLTLPWVMASTAASADWAATRAFDPIKNEARCVVESIRQIMHDGYSDTDVYLQVDKTSLLVRTRSNIDASKSDIGVTVDKQEFIPMDKVYLDQNAEFDKEIAKIVGQFKKGLKAVFTLHFWPTYPDTGAKTVIFSLIGFTKAYEDFGNCQ
jgi:hypothetical protein